MTNAIRNDAASSHITFAAPSERDQHAGERRTEQIGDVSGALDEAVRLGELLLAFTDDGGQDQPLAGEVGARERAEQRRDHEDHAERQTADDVQERHDRDDRRPGAVRHQHRGLRPEPLDDRAGGDAEQRHRRQLDGEHEPHLRRRARGDEYEPRQREVRQLRPETGDQLGAEERDDRTVADHRRGA